MTSLRWMLTVWLSLASVSGRGESVTTTETQKYTCKTFGSGVIQPFNGSSFYVRSNCPFTFTRFTHNRVECDITTRRGDSGLLVQVEIIINKIRTVLQNGSILVEKKSVSLPYDHTYQHIFHYGTYTKLRSSLLPLSVTWHNVPGGIDTLWVELEQELSTEMTGLCGKNNVTGNKQQLIKQSVLADDTCQIRDAVSIENQDCRMFFSYTLDCWMPHYIQLCDKNIYNYEMSKTISCAFYKEVALRCGSSSYVWNIWRYVTGCAKPSCPGDLIYVEEGPAYVPSCSNPNPRSSNQDLISSCVCPVGKVLNDHADGSYCVSVSSCPCVFAGTSYSTGDIRSTKCQSCVCDSGKWQCSENLCPPRCLIEGQFVTTVDGKEYVLPGKCTYVALQGLNWTITIEFSEKAPSLKTVILQLFQETYTFSANMVKFREEQITELHESDHALVFWKSSMYVQVHTFFGMNMQVQMSPEIQLYITPPANHTGMISGLCGNSNNDTTDDFTTSSGIIENSAQPFAQSWSVGACLPNIPNNCINRDNEIFADEKCSVLNDPAKIFAKCHSHIPTDHYHTACIQRTCNCGGSVQQCLCAALGSYAQACASMGVAVGDWRKATNCTVKCPKNQEFSYITRACNHTCRSLSGPDPRCEVDDAPVEGCGCPEGTHLNQEQVCTPKSECVCHYYGGTTPPGPAVLDGRKCLCENGELQCSKDCGCTNGKVCVHCAEHPVNTAQKTCDSLSKPKGIGMTCDSGCYCPYDQYEDHLGNCVSLDNCTCVYSGKVFSAGQSVKTSCKTCVCGQGQWHCRDEPCPGKCQVYGNGHYQTFDSKWYRFDGHCQYTLVEDGCGSSNGTFSVRVESVPCCDEALTCSRSIILDLQNTVTLTLSDMKVTRRHHSGWTLMEDSLYSTHTVGLYIIISVPGKGITLIWDKHTRVTVVLHAHWRNKVCGLCGNFDSNEMNDLQISGSGVLSSPMVFGNSWKAATPPCSDVTTEIFPCERNSYCSAWAQRRCMILTGDTFKECHFKVDPEPFYHACVQESCSCEFEGKFLGFCTAVAAYAEACSDQDVCVNWRTPDLCPVYCDYYNEQGQCSWHYEACGNVPTCGKGNDFTHKLEGCYPRCSKETPYYDENTGACTKLRNCTCYFNDTVIQPGALVLVQSIMCHCQNGTVTCPSPPTTTPATAPTPATTPTTTASTTYETTVLYTTTTPTATTETTVFSSTTTPTPTTETLSTNPPIKSTSTTQTTSTTAETTMLSTTSTPATTTAITTAEPWSTAPPVISTSTTTTASTTTASTTVFSTPTTPTTVSTSTKTETWSTANPTTSTQTTPTTPAITETTVLSTNSTPTTTTSSTTTETTAISTTAEPTATTASTVADTWSTATPTTSTGTTPTTPAITETTVLSTNATPTDSTASTTTETTVLSTISTPTTTATSTTTETTGISTTSEPTTTGTSTTTEATGIFTTSEPTTTATSTSTETTAISTTSEPTASTTLTVAETWSTASSATSTTLTTSVTTETTVLSTTSTPTTTTSSTTAETTSRSTMPYTNSTLMTTATSGLTTTENWSTKLSTTSTPHQTTTVTSETPEEVTNTSAVTTSIPTTSSTTLSSTPSLTTAFSTQHTMITNSTESTTEQTSTTELPIPESSTSVHTTLHTTPTTSSTKASTTWTTESEPTESTVSTETFTTQLTTEHTEPTASTPQSTTTFATNATTVTTTEEETFMSSAHSTSQPTTTSSEATTSYGVISASVTPPATHSTERSISESFTSATATTEVTTPEEPGTTMSTEQTYLTSVASTTTKTTFKPASTESTTVTDTPTTYICECKDLKRKKRWSCGETWTEDCFSKTCINGKIELTPVVCPEPTIPICPRKQVTKVSDGCCETWKCDCRCDLFGDPHYISFQGVTFDFLEECTYVLVEERSPRHHLTIAVDNFYCVQGLQGSCAKGVIVKYQNNTATLDINTNSNGVQATLNNMTINPPYEEQGLRFETTGYIVFIYLPEVRSYVSLSPSWTLVVSLAMEHFVNNTQGQCGVCGVGSCVRKGGKIEDDHCCDKTAYDWMYDDPLRPACVSAPRDIACKSKTTPVPTFTPTITTTCPASQICELLHHPVFSNCSRYVDLIPKKRNCEFDACRNGACSSLEQAAEECKKAGFCIDWRRLTNGSCNITCPEGLVFQECRTKLDDYCDKGIRHAGISLENNSTGCFCPSGKFRAQNHSNICVSDCPYCKGPLGEPKLPGDVWQSNCHLCTCDNRTRSEQCFPKTPQPSPICSHNAVLVNTSCCGDQICVDKTCSYHGKTYKVGDRWQNETLPCMSFKCSTEGIQTEMRACPTENCREEDRIWDDQHCCFTCKQICAPKVTSINITIDNCTAVMQMPVCQGQCASEPRIVLRGVLQVVQEYQSCQVQSAEKRSVTLQCFDLTTRKHAYKHITGCECRACGALHQ